MLNPTTHPSNIVTSTATAQSPREELERNYLTACQRIEELLERKKHLVEESNDLASLHQELDMIGSRIQRNPRDESQDEDYLAVVRRAKECLWRQMESEQIRGEFQTLHFELLGLGQRLGYQGVPPAPIPVAQHAARRAAPTPITSTLDEESPETGMDMVERQIAELQNRIRGLTRV